MVINDEKVLSLYDVFAGKTLAFYLILYIINITCSLTKGVSKYDNGISAVMAILFLSYLVFHQRMLSRVWRSIILYDALLFAFYVIGAVVNNNYTFEIVTRMYWTLLYGIPLGCIWSKVENVHNALLPTEWAANLITFCGVLIFIMSIIGISTLSSTSYSMSLGYTMLFPLCLYIMRVRYSLKYIIPCIADLIVILLKGSRGPVLCIAIFVYLLYFTRNGLKTRLGLFFATISCVGTFVIVLFYRSILKFIVDLLAVFGIYSRSLGYFLERTFYTGRETVWGAAIECIGEKYLTGWGIGYNTLMRTGLQPHNIFLEILLQYGLIFGSFILLVLLYLLIKGALGRQRGRNETSVMFLVMGFIPLLLSGSYLTWPFFWVLIAICIKRTGERGCIRIRI